MSTDPLKVEDLPQVEAGRMVVAFTGWMDGGDVSTGTVEWLIDQTGADPFAEIDPEGFYIFNFPGSMEVSALFRPHVQIEAGLVQEFEPPENTFYVAPEHNLVMFIGKEPHLHWRMFREALFGLAQQMGVQEIFFVGSVAGMVPHTREPRLRCAVSDAHLKPRMEQAGVPFTDYEGPSSFSAYLLTEAPQQQLDMVSFVVEIPAYIQGRNPKGIETVCRKLTALLEVDLNMDELRDTSDHWEKRIDEAVHEREDLAEHIHKLEEDYDHEVFDTQMGDLKDWLEKQGIQVD
ncbi:MAG: PAC2 family protein [Phycisphaeraceae bacterium]